MPFPPIRHSCRVILIMLALSTPIAAFADRSRHEKIAKTIIFMPMAISLVGAGVIWKFIYAVKDPSESQIGLLNAIVVALAEPFGAVRASWNHSCRSEVWLGTMSRMILIPS